VEASPSQSLEARVKLLESALRQQDIRFAALMSLVHDHAARILGDPLTEFFARPDYFDVLVPAGPDAQCVKDCANQYAAASKRCSELPEAERSDCMVKAFQQRVACMEGCYPL
jgi:hypothetical protein